MKYLADPHLGRKFKNGVPLARAGERRKLQRSCFRREILGIRENLCVLGDLFDTTIVDNDDLLFAYDILDKWCGTNPKCFLYVLEGNHDASRSGKTTSFDVLAEMCSNISNVTFIRHRAHLELGVLFIPYVYGKSPEDLYNEFKNFKPNAEFQSVCCHADVGDIPFLTSLNCEVHSGHLHNFWHPTIRFEQSLLPLNYAESVGHPRGDLYIRYNSVKEFEATNPEDYKNKCVNVVVQNDELPPSVEDINCLQFTTKKASEIELEKEMSEVELGDFDSRQVFEECMKDVDLELKEAIWERYKG